MYVVYVIGVVRQGGPCMLSTLSVLFVIVACVVYIYIYVISVVRHSGPCKLSTLSVLFGIVARVVCLRYQCCSS